MVETEVPMGRNMPLQRKLFTGRVLQELRATSLLSAGGTGTLDSSLLPPPRLCCRSVSYKEGEFFAGGGRKGKSAGGRREERAGEMAFLFFSYPLSFLLRPSSN